MLYICKIKTEVVIWQGKAKIVLHVEKELIEKVKDNQRWSITLLITLALGAVCYQKI